MAKGTKGTDTNPNRSKKRKFYGNRYTNEQNSKESTSKAAEKLQNSDDSCFDVEVDPMSGYVIINFLSVFSMLSAFLMCKNCHKDISFTKFGVRGLGFKLCLTCGCEKRYIDSCPRVGVGYEVNRRIVFVMRLIGVGLAGINKFCGMMELGRGLHKTAYYDILSHITTAVNSVFDAVTRKAVTEEQEKQRSKGLPEDVLTVSGDGSWARRGFSSLIGIVSLILKFTGKIVDVAIRSSVCKACDKWKGREKEPEYTVWYEEHEKFCNINHTGSSGLMEVNGIVEMFLRSIEKFAVKYGFYIGDGDTKTFKMLLNTMPYGSDFEVKKLECVLHVAKRVFKRVNEARKALIQKKKALKQAEGKAAVKKPAKKSVPKKSAASKVAAKKKAVARIAVVKTQGLTIKLMKELSENYGLAIRRNPDSVENMRKEIWAGFYHKISTDKKPQHSYCSPSWCKYLKAKENKSLKKYKHKPALSDEVQEVLKPIYEDLTKTELLERCLGCHTQNNNESYNHCVWNMVPKHLFNGKQVVEIASKTAACIFNEGYIPVLKIMEEMGLKIGSSSVDYADNHDSTRIELANRHSLDTSRESRTERKKARSAANESFEQEEGTSYGAGIAD